MSQRDRKPAETPEQHLERVRLTNLWIEAPGLRAWLSMMRGCCGDGRDFFTRVRLFGPKDSGARSRGAS